MLPGQGLRWRLTKPKAMFSPKLRLDPDLHRRAEKHAQALGYSSLEEFVTHLLEREMKPLSAEDQEKLDERLKGLGYL